MARAAKYRQARKAPPVVTHRRDKGRPWRRARRAYFDSEPTNRLCQECLKLGITRQADVVDHIQTVASRPDLEFDQSNLQGLCNECHDKKTARENTGN